MLRTSGHRLAGINGNHYPLVRLDIAERSGSRMESPVAPTNLAGENIEIQQKCVTFSDQK